MTTSYTGQEAPLEGHKLRLVAHPLVKRPPRWHHAPCSQIQTRVLSHLLSLYLSLSPLSSLYPLFSLSLSPTTFISSPLSVSLHPPFISPSSRLAHTHTHTHTHTHFSRDLREGEPDPS